MLAIVVRYVEEGLKGDIADLITHLLLELLHFVSIRDNLAILNLIINNTEILVD